MDPQIAADGHYLSMELDGQVRRFHAVWLRDNSLHPDSRNPDNGQRLITLLDQPADPVIVSAHYTEPAVLRVQFQDEETVHDFPLTWLARHCYDHQTPAPAEGWVAATISCWGSDLQHRIPTATFDELAADNAVLTNWLAAIRRYGVALVQQLPDDPEALLRVVDLFGFVRETNYGRYFEVRSEVNPINLAYTGLGLQAHTDNPYRDPVPTLQLLACLENSTEGGESMVVDGFQAARQLLQENPEHFALLHQYCARFHYAGGDGVALHSKRPMLELSPDGELIAVRFNNRSASPFTDIPFAVMTDYYRAYRHFAAIIERPENTVRFRLQPRELFIVDNLRVLHSRTAFSGTGTRWLRGCYADKDGLLSTLAALETQA